MKLSAEVQSIFNQEKDKITLKEILSRVNKKSFGLLLVILSLPSALPVPAPGYSTPFAIAIIFLVVGMLKGDKHPKLPKKILNKKIKTNKDSKTIFYMIKFLKFFEKFIKPRGQKFYHRKWYQNLLAIIILLCAGTMVIPFPLTNTLPAFGIFLIGMGFLEEDFLFSLGGLSIAIAGSCLGILIIILTLFFGPEAVNALKDFLEGIKG